MGGISLTANAVGGAIGSAVGGLFSKNWKKQLLLLIDVFLSNFLYKLLFFSVLYLLF